LREATLAERGVAFEGAADARDLDRVHAHLHVSSRIGGMAGESIRVTRTVVLPLSDVEFRTSRSSGPGGQHAQKTETRVEAVFDVERSAALSDAQKRRVVARGGPVLRAVAQDERSQSRNRELA